MQPQWVLGDPHGGHDRRADEALVALLARAAAERVDLVVMGDLFVAWLAPERFWTPLQRRILEALAAVRAAGGQTRLVVGNRDYLAETLAGSVFDAVYPDEVVVPVAGRPTLLCHGDRLNPADWPYHTWRRLSRSAPVEAVLRRLPGPAGRALAARTEARMAGVNARYKTGQLPLAALEALGRRAAAQGAARALVGHFHHDRVLPVAGGAPVVVAPGWFEHRRVLVGTSDGALRSVPVEALLPGVD
jgi:UDP-2,3-diacylglucosamine hydrolase